MTAQHDTIAAIATPPGSGGVAIIRVSGPLAKTVAQALFVSSRPSFSELKPYRLHHGHILDAPQGKVVDEGLVAFMPGPGSYTGEDVVEFHCHGGPVIVASVLRAVLDQGVRAADPGEFTKQAFVNGRMDLSQAEAVAEMIAARSEAGANLAQRRLSGLMGERVRALRAELLALSEQACVAVDFPDDDIECLPPQDFSRAVERVARAVEELLSGYERARPFEDGVLAVLAGEVNAGKSSLMNALLGRNRAIVADLPGTTRDYLEESLLVDGMPLRLVDTAGLRETLDSVEQEGVRMGQDLAERADLVLLVKDAGLALSDEECEFLAKAGAGRVLGVVNKIDVSPEGAAGIEAALAGMGVDSVRISAKTGQGLEELATAIRTKIMHGRHDPAPGELAPNLRQSRALAQTLEELNALVQDIIAGVPYDLLGVRLQTACSLLAEITGEIAPQEVLDSIFSRFCIGK